MKEVRRSGSRGGGVIGGAIRAGAARAGLRVAVFDRQGSPRPGRRPLGASAGHFFLGAGEFGKWCDDGGRWEKAKHALLSGVRCGRVEEKNSSKDSEGFGRKKVHLSAVFALIYEKAGQLKHHYRACTPGLGIERRNASREGWPEKSLEPAWS